MSYKLKVDKNFLKTLLTQDLLKHNQGHDLVLQAIENKDLEMVSYLIDHGCDMNRLCLACELQDINLVRLLLSKGVNPNCSKNGESAITIATKTRNLNILKLLVQAGANYNLEQAIETAVYQNNTQLIKFLLSYASVEVGKSVFKSLFLTKKIQKCCTYEILDLFFEYDKFFINITDSNNNTLLHKFAQFADLETITFLLERGADDTIINNKGLTAKQIVEKQLNGRHYHQAQETIKIFEQYEMPIKFAVESYE